MSEVSQSAKNAYIYTDGRDREALTERVLEENIRYNSFLLSNIRFVIIPYVYYSSRFQTNCT